MNTTRVGLVVFICVFGGVVLGMWLRTILPKHHLDSDSKDTVKVGIGLIATMTALVLGLVTASAKSAFDGVNAAVKQTAINILALDRVLARYGPETGEIRKGLQQLLASRIDTVWPQGSSERAKDDPMKLGSSVGRGAIGGGSPRSNATRRVPAGAPVSRAGPDGSDVAGQVASFRWRRHSDSRAVPCRALVLADDHIHELWVVCSAERDGARSLVRLRTVRHECLVSGSGNGWAVRWGSSKRPQIRCGTLMRTSINNSLTPLSC